ncbi:hypothetical protein EXU48_05980 [Occultella glacieicola]|uniref:J domain-containing protein n=1 Tax=Occultella glacieicola TaxID=2518684 RepID=A0ABY2E5E7_9MICO|nr:hypothetical protein [Occultella glacieicola]TDE95808.1 hypothetical protein EXU48_05980 [Occultella glacieicola]
MGHRPEHPLALIARIHHDEAVTAAERRRHLAAHPDQVVPPRWLVTLRRLTAAVRTGLERRGARGVGAGGARTETRTATAAATRSGAASAAGAEECAGAACRA